jgi:hypothetical protein
MKSKRINSCNQIEQLLFDALPPPPAQSQLLSAAAESPPSTGALEAVWASFVQQHNG